MHSRLVAVGYPEDAAAELAMHIKEAVQLRRRELLSGYLAWRWAYEVERGALAEEVADQFKLAREATLSYFPEAADIWPDVSDDRLSVAEARLPLLDDSEEGRLGARYLELLLASKRREATQLILSEVDAGLSIDSLYLNVFQPVLREIGRLWQINELQIGQEHFCTAVSQAIMAQLYPRIFSHDPIGRLVIATTVSGELHEIGIRMVADIFEMHGWDTYYMSSDCPSEAIIDSLLAQQPHALAIGVTTLRNIDNARKLITEVRSMNQISDTVVLVGGHIFVRMPTLWQEIGADGWAQDAISAVSEANRLTGASQ